MPLSWDAVKMKWAPDKLKGTPPEKGYPRVPAGPLPKGKYALKVASRRSRTCSRGWITR